MRLHVQLFSLSRNIRMLCGASLVVLLSLSCSSSLEPRAGVTVLVTNATCVPGPCSSQEILAFPAANQPNTPGGAWSLDLGIMTGSELCVTLPTSATLSINFTKIVWTNAMPVTLGTLPPSASRFMATSSTSSFVPATSDGWALTLPGAVEPIASPRCTP